MEACGPFFYPMQWLLFPGKLNFHCWNVVYIVVCCFRNSKIT